MSAGAGKQLRRMAAASVWLAYLHMMFGGIVRITGSGMGCGDHWPKCNGAWLPPFDNPTVAIEWTHRLLAALLILALAGVVAVAWATRDQPGVGGKGGVLRSAVTAAALVVIVALVGMVSVKLGNATLATVAHWTLALALLAVAIATAVRAGAFGGTSAAAQGGSARAMRSLGAAAAIAFVAVVLGGLVAKSPGAAVACTSFPHCGVNPAAPPGASALQLWHRVVGYLLFFHVLAVTIAIVRRPGEAAAVKDAAKGAAALVVLQLIAGATMIFSGLRPDIRAAHQALGVGVWFVVFLGVYLARTASKAGMENGESRMGT